MSWSVLVANAGRLAVLAVPVVLGALVAQLGVIRDPEAAVDALNVYTLHVGFPALIATGVVGVDASVAGSWSFWAVVPVVDAVLIAASVLVAARMDGRQAGTLSLVCLFGNTAYLGIPFVVSVLGEHQRGPAALLVAVQVTLAVALGPWLLARWSGAEGTRPSAVGLLAQPLLWSPLLGVGVRLLPRGAEGAAMDVLSPLAASTAPVAMFLLGLYLHRHREALRRPEPGVWAHVALRMAGGAVVGAAVGLALSRWAGLHREHLPVIVILGGEPVAISTFSIAHRAGVAPERVAAVVVRSSVAAVVVLPLLATVAERLDP